MAYADAARADPTAGDKPKRTDDESRALLATARKRFDRACSVEADNREAALDDLRFYNGEHWPPHLVQERSKPNAERIMITINRFPTLVHQVTNAQRMNRPGIDISPDGDEGDAETAKMLRGYIRKVQRLPESEIAIDTAFESTCKGGWGYWRFLTEHESTTSFDQVLCWKRIRNPFQVYLDDSCQDPTGADARWAFVTELMNKDEFKRQYPEASETNFDAGGRGENYSQWNVGDDIRIAEYWLVELEKSELVALQDGWVGFKDDLAPEVKERIKADPSLIEASRESERAKVCCYKINGYEVLEEYEWLGSCIPIVRLTGDETDIEGKVTYSGIVRHAKDAARMYDFWVTKGTEGVALANQIPYIMEEGQIGVHKALWQDANKKNLPYLLYKGTNVAGKPAPPPQRQPFAGVPAGIMAMSEGAQQDMLATTGIRFDATKNERVMDESGIALENLRRNTDLGSFHYHDNMARALKVSGQIFIDVVPKLLRNKRVITVLHEDDREEKVMLDPYQSEPMAEIERNGQKMRSFNPTIGKYNVAVTIGPNFSTKRKEATAGQLQLVSALGPEYAKVIADLIAKNQDWDQSEEVSRRFAMMLPPGMMQVEMKNVDPHVQALVGQLQQQLQQLQQEKQQLVQALTEKQSAIAIDVEKNRIDDERAQKDFVAKLMKIAADSGVSDDKMMREQVMHAQDQALELEKLELERQRAMAQLLQALQPETRAQ